MIQKQRKPLKTFNTLLKNNQLNTLDTLPKTIKMSTLDVSEFGFEMMGEVVTFSLIPKPWLEPGLEMMGGGTLWLEMISFPEMIKAWL